MQARRLRRKHLVHTHMLVHVRTCAPAHANTPTNMRFCMQAVMTRARSPLLWAPQAIAKSFGFSVPPRVTLALESKSKHTRKAAKLMAQLGARSGKGKGDADYRRVSGHAFSAANPRGQRDSSDKRQFVRL